ncbi:MAG: hypothetical protein HGB12_12285 [Bacteroidetes bacterium]|nr:hypothetical protein [Bacteroidota bacterium]
MKKTKEIFISSFKGFYITDVASLVFIVAISIFQIIGSFSVEKFPLMEVLYNNLKLLLILCVLGLPVGLYIGLYAGKMKLKRLFWMLLVSFFIFWLMIIIVIILKSDFSFSGNYINDILQMSVWAMLAYSFFAVPLIIMTVFFIERWKRK